MNILNIIDKKRLNKHLEYEELDYAFNGYLNKNIPDYQMSALLMAICINKIDDKEILDLTDIFIKSGQVLDVSAINGPLVDKHSTGGVGDKTTMIIGPIIAACGLKMAKMSGRGLGLTGGTIDKLESIPGFNVNLSIEDFLHQVDNIGFATIAQNENLVPMDKKVYALRDATATCESLGLIAVSIMSKKIASGSKNILIDVKYGKGALIKSKDDAYLFSQIAEKIGQKYNCKVKCIIDNMDMPLGDNIGNSLEVLEAIDILNGKNNYLKDLCLKLAATLISMGKDINYDEAYKLAQEAIDNKKAYEKFQEFVKAQGGDITKIRVSPYKVMVKSLKNGQIVNIDAHKIAQLARAIGCFRETKEDKIDYSLGIVLNKRLNDKVKKDDILCELYVKENYNKNIYDQAINCFEIKED